MENSLFSGLSCEFLEIRAKNFDKISIFYYQFELWIAILI